MTVLFIPSWTIGASSIKQRTDIKTSFHLWILWTCQNEIMRRVVFSFGDWLSFFVWKISSKTKKKKKKTQGNFATNGLVKATTLKLRNFCTDAARFHVTKVTAIIVNKNQNSMKVCAWTEKYDAESWRLIESTWK